MKKRIKILLLLIIYIGICFNIYNINNDKNTTKINTSLVTKIGRNIQNIKYKEDKIGELYIKNINLKENLYKENSYLNNVDKNIAIIKGSSSPEIDNSIMVIAAHSGTGHLAYFQDLNKLNINDEVLLNYNNKNYIYTIKDMWNDKKTGTIKIPKENTNQLILTTCSPNRKNYQLIINCTKKE